MHKISFVLTGTIVPNSTFVVHDNVEKRREEYLRAIRFYSQIGTVYFLENSSYDLLNDRDFTKMKNVNIRKFPKSDNYNKGKGYQEFEMLDAWVAAEEELPDRWIKITGRYIIENIKSMVEKCTSEVQREFIADAYLKKRVVNTFIFYITTDFYRKYITGIYQECDDSKGLWIEKILFNKMGMFPLEKFSYFNSQPKLSGLSGTTGVAFRSPTYKTKIKTLLRKFNYQINKNYIVIKFI